MAGTRNFHARDRRALTAVLTAEAIRVGPDLAAWLRAGGGEGLERALADPAGIIPALEPSHALAHVIKIAPDLPADHIIVMNMCGRGDKDIFTVAKHLGQDLKT